MTKLTRFPAVILAGGVSRRMGTDKAMIGLGETPLALRIAERLSPQVSTVALNAPAGHPLSGHLPLLHDGKPDRPGPLAGVLAGLRASSGRPEAPTHSLTTPCDTPFLPRNLVQRLAEFADSGTIVIASSAGRTHPVTALWPVELAEDLDRWLDDRANRRVFDFIARHPTQTVDFPVFDGPFGPVDPFFNINTPEDLSYARAILDGGEP